MPGIAGQRPDLPHGEGASHPPRGPSAALLLRIVSHKTAIRVSDNNPTQFRQL
ncbi:hypothetical protein CLV80_102204 [Yoonia maritima]|uniref:Uncharacterized protein n=1 Tax=Yoonia maritima TaxID=1435347 RepID=A0A2T0W2Z5_9RHOB|nr:hypothetical protein CLV80_102204 [Yoonia maritima]